MAYPFFKDLQIVQWGKESTAGTIVAATSKIPADLTLTPIDKVEDPHFPVGIAMASPGYEIAVGRGINWAMGSSPMLYDNFQAWLAMTLVGGVTAVGAMAPYSWTYTMNPLTLPTVDTRSFEIRQTDGATPVDWKVGYGVCSKLELTGAEMKQITVSGSGFARRLQTATLTPALSLPSIIQEPLAATTLYIDSTWANRGMTAVAGQILGWKWTFETGFAEIYTADARSDLDFTVAAPDTTKRKITLEIDLLALSGGQWQTEKTAAEGNTLRAIELRMTGPTLGAGNYSLKLQQLMKYKPVASVFPDQSKNGWQLAKLKLESSTDQTNQLAAVLQNNVNTLP